MDSSQPTNQFVNHEQLDLIRVRRVWQYFAVLVLAWISFTVMFPILGYPGVLAHHFWALSCFALVYLWFRDDKNFSRARAERMAFCYLAIHSIAIFAIGLTSPDLQSTLLALPFGTTIAFMLLGRRASVPWLIVSLLAFIAYPIIVYGWQAFMPPSPLFMDSVMKCGAATVIFICFCNFELLYLRHNEELVKLSHNLETLATTDALTGLPNQFQFNKNLAHEIARASKKKTNLALTLLDMDGFKQLNDTLGHSVGDEALVEIAARLKSTTKQNTTVARLGGDEFCVILSDVKNRAHVESLTQQLHDLLCQDYALTNVDCQLGASIGIAFYPDDADHPEQLLAYADTAMYHAKENHLPFACYDTEQTVRVVEYSSVQKKLAKAIENDEFFLVYQPQIEIRTGQIIGAEALLRWQHEGELIPPLEFIPHLEASRRITEVTAWILDNVCGQINLWGTHGLHLKVAVNTSAIDFHSSEFVGMVKSAINRNQIDASLLELEITENVLIKDVSAVADRMHQLKETGLTISIDDFGTGYSSLPYLRSLPIDKLKIDREFVKGIPDADDCAIASSIVMLAKTLDFEVLAEGVENETQLEYLRSTDCDYFQGYLSSRPISADELENLALETQRHELNQLVD